MESIAQVPSLLPAAFSCSECLLGVSERWRCGGSVFSSVALLFFSLLSHRLLSCAWCAVRFVLRLLFLSSTCLFYKRSNVSTLGSRLYGGAHQLPFWGRRQRLVFKSHLVFRALTVLVCLCILLFSFVLCSQQRWLFAFLTRYIRALCLITLFLVASPHSGHRWANTARACRSFRRSLLVPAPVSYDSFCVGIVHYTLALIPTALSLPIATRIIIKHYPQHIKFLHVTILCPCCIAHALFLSTTFSVLQQYVRCFSTFYLLIPHSLITVFICCRIV